MDNGKSTVARTPNPDCPCCVFKLRHVQDTRMVDPLFVYHPLAGHGYTKETGWTHPDLAVNKVQERK